MNATRSHTFYATGASGTGAALEETRAGDERRWTILAISASGPVTAYAAADATDPQAAEAFFSTPDAALVTFFHPLRAPTPGTQLAVVLTGVTGVVPFLSVQYVLE